MYEQLLSLDTEFYIHQIQIMYKTFGKTFKNGVQGIREVTNEVLECE